MKMELNMESFSYPGWIKWFGGFGVLFFGPFAFIAGWFTITSNDIGTALINAAALVIMIILFLGCIDIVRRSDDTFAVTESGLNIDDSNGKLLVVWNQIAKIKSHDIMQRIDLLDLNDERIVKIDYQLDKFDNLCDVILTKIMGISKSEQRTFIISWCTRGFIIVLIISSAFFTVWSLTKEFILGLIMFSAMTVCMICSYLNSVKTIVIEVNKITVKTVFKLKEIYFSDISSVVLRYKGDFRGSKIATVFVECKERKPVLFVVIQGGALGLYRSIYEAWQATIKPV